MKQLKFNNRDKYLLSEMKADLKIANDKDNPKRYEALEYVWGDILRHFTSEVLREANNMDAFDPRGFFKRRNAEYRSLCWNNPIDIDENDGKNIYYLEITALESLVYYLGCVQGDKAENDAKYLEKFKKSTKMNPDFETGADIFELLEEWGVLGIEENSGKPIKPMDAIPGLVPLYEINDPKKRFKSMTAKINSI